MLMEKTVQITIASTTFSLTDGAYAMLSKYLETLKAHFVGEAESAEIIRDIESRIAEKLLHKKSHVITETDITAVTVEIGDASEFDDEETADSPRPTKPSTPRRLFRDMDNAWVGGVASGIGAYFDIDAFWIRLAFLVSLFFGGSGIFVYIILWILIPEAKSSSQKLEMHGQPVNLEGIARVVKESVEDARESGAVRNFFGGIHRIIRGFFRILGKIVGTILVVDAFFGMIALVIGTGIVLANWNAPYNDFPLRDVVSDGLLVGGLTVGFVAVLIPLMFIFTLGIRLFSKKTVLPSAVAFGLIGIWALAVSAAGTIAVTVAGQYFEHMRTTPEYQQEMRSLDLPAFTKIHIDNQNVTIRNGTTTTVTLDGRVIDMDEVVAKVVDGTLTLWEKDHYEMCIFCSHNSPHIIVTVPDIESVLVTNGSVTFDEYMDEELSVDSVNASVRGMITSNTFAFTSEFGNARFGLTTDTLTLESAASHIELLGSAKSAELKFDDSSFNGDSFEIDNAKLFSDDSYGEVFVTGTLEKIKYTDSRILNTAVPEEGIE